MSDTQDIRLWAKEQGLNVAPKGKIPTAVMEQWQQREGANADYDTGEVAPVSFGGDTERTRPAPDRSRMWWNKQKAKDKADVTKPAPKRVSIESVVSYGWGMGAYALAQNPRLIPVARVLDMQAPVAGIVVNDVARGTVIDRALQPLARAGEKGEKASGLLGPPLLVAAITLRPDLYPVLRPVLKMSIMSWMEISEPAMKKAQSRAEKFSEKFGNVDVDSMIDALFAPPPGYVPDTAEDLAEAA